MAKKLDKSDIVSLNTIRPYHVSQSVDALTGIEAYDISISGSLNVTGSTTLSAGTFTSIGTSGYLSHNGAGTAGQLVQLSGSSNGLIRNDISALSGSFPNTLSQGVRGVDEASFPGYGKSGDAFVYASNYVNGLNIINYGEGIKEDYIRFYAGKQATSQSDIHIQGSGSTKGYVGVNTETPTSHLHVSGTLANGFSVTTIGTFSHAEGNGSVSTGVGSHSEGFQTRANGIYSHAEGRQSLSSGPYSHAEGLNATSSGDYSHAEGIDTKAFGTASHAEGNQTTAMDNYSHAEGALTLAMGFGSHAEGVLTTASANYSHAEGVRTIASGIYSHAEGIDTIASNTASHAEGNQTTSSGNFSHTEGNQTTAMGDYSHAEGSLTLAMGFGSHAEGLSTTSSGIYSHAEGRETFASGSYSFAHGYLSKAHGDYAHAGGIGTVASGSSGQSVVGRYNTHNDSTSRFIVGNGTDDSTRLDAFKVTNNNSIVVAPRAAAPAWIGTEGEMVPAIVGGVFYLYVYLGGNWRKTTLT
jgi:hypothetical protein